MAAPTYEELNAELSELHLDNDEKCDELVEIRAELHAAKIETQELRLRLQATGTKITSVVPTEVRAGLGANLAGNPEAELRHLLKWLAADVVLEDPVALNCCCDVMVSDGQHVQIRNIVQWRLKGDLRLSVPEELAPEISNLLSAAKADSNMVCQAKAKSILDSWQLTHHEAPPSGTTSRVTLLTHRESQRSCLVANFPLPPPPPPPQPKLYQAWAGVSIGDKVEVNFDGNWLQGSVEFIRGEGLAYVHCDADPPEVFVMSPINLLRWPSETSPPAAQEPCKNELSHARQAST